MNSCHSVVVWYAKLGRNPRDSEWRNQVVLRHRGCGGQHAGGQETVVLSETLVHRLKCTVDFPKGQLQFTNRRSVCHQSLSVVKCRCCIAPQGIAVASDGLRGHMILRSPGSGRSTELLELRIDVLGRKRCEDSCVRFVTAASKDVSMLLHLMQ